MDISQSNQFLEAAIKTKTDELSVLQLAKQIINDTYSAEFTAINTAQAEANQLAIEKNEAIQDKIVLEANIQTEIYNLVTEKEEQKLRAETAEATLVIKENEITELKRQLVPAETVNKIIE